jgi:cell division septation protein DedD
MKTLQMVSAETAAEEPAKESVKETSNIVKLEHPMKHLMEDTADNAEETIDTADDDNDDDVVRIKFSWIRNSVAVAAILLAVFFVAMPTGQTEMMTRTISNLNNQLLFGMMSSKDTNTSTINFKRKDVHKPTAKTSEAILDTIKPTKPAETSKSAIKPAKREGYCIVLASQVTKQNAEDFISRLAKRGYEGAEVYVHNNITRVVYGHFDNQADAYKRLQKVSKEKELEEAWVYKYNEKSE